MTTSFADLLRSAVTEPDTSMLVTSPVSLSVVERPPAQRDTERESMARAVDRHTGRTGGAGSPLPGA